MGYSKELANGIDGLVIRGHQIITNNRSAKTPISPIQLKSLDHHTAGVHDFVHARWHKGFIFSPVVEEIPVDSGSNAFASTIAVVRYVRATNKMGKTAKGCFSNASNAFILQCNATESMIERGLELVKNAAGNAILFKLLDAETLYTQIKEKNLI